MIKVAVVGVGNLGSCVAYEIANRGLVDRLILIDVYRELAEGNADDITQALAFRNETEVLAGDYEDAKGSHAIIVTAGKPRTPEMRSRMDLLEVNKKIIEDVASNIRKMGESPIIVTLTNPVDVMNYLMQKTTGIDRRKVIGSAGMLDSSRFKVVLSQRLRTSIMDIEAYVIGEHGDYQVPLFSQVRIKGKKRSFNKNEQNEIMSEIRQAALKVISKKGATIFAPANNTANIVEMILRDEKKMAVCSVILRGEYGVDDVSIGVPVILGCEGVERILEYELDEDEKEMFTKGAQYLKRTIKEILKE